MAQEAVGQNYPPRCLEDGFEERRLRPRTLASARVPRFELGLLVYANLFDFTEEIDVRVVLSVKDAGIHR